MRAEWTQAAWRYLSTQSSKANVDAPRPFNTIFYWEIQSDRNCFFLDFDELGFHSWLAITDRSGTRNRIFSCPESTEKWVKGKLNIKVFFIFGMILHNEDKSQDLINLPKNPFPKPGFGVPNPSLIVITHMNSLLYNMNDELCTFEFRYSWDNITCY